MSQNPHFVKNCEGFFWDEGTAKRYWTKHQVTRLECEEI